MHEPGEPRLTRPPQAFSSKNASEIGKGPVKIPIDDDVVVIGPMPKFVGGLDHPAADDVVVVLRPGSQATLKLRAEGGRTKMLTIFPATALAAAASPASRCRTARLGHWPVPPRPARSASRKGGRIHRPTPAARLGPSSSGICAGRQNDSHTSSTSPGRRGRVVTETDITSPWSASSRARERVVLPAPDGDDSTSITPAARWIRARQPSVTPGFALAHEIARPHS